MKELLSTASNSFYRTNDKGEIGLMYEIVLVVSEPNFRVDAAGQIVRDRQTESLRIVVNPRSLESVVEYFNELLEQAANDPLQTPPHERAATVAKGKSN